MKADFTVDEKVYNTILKGMKLYHEEDDILHEIDYVKIKKKTRQLKVHCVDGSVFLANQDDIFSWEVTTELEDKPVTKKKNKKKKN